MPKKEPPKMTFNITEVCGFKKGLFGGVCGFKGGFRKNGDMAAHIINTHKISIPPISLHEIAESYAATSDEFKKGKNGVFGFKKPTKADIDDVLLKIRLEGSPTYSVNGESKQKVSNGITYITAKITTLILGQRFHTNGNSYLYYRGLDINTKASIKGLQRNV